MPPRPPRHDSPWAVPEDARPAELHDQELAHIQRDMRRYLLLAVAGLVLAVAAPAGALWLVKVALSLALCLLSWSHVRTRSDDWRAAGLQGNATFVGWIALGGVVVSLLVALQHLAVAS